MDVFDLFLIMLKCIPSNFVPYALFVVLFLGLSTNGPYDVFPILESKRVIGVVLVLSYE